MEHFLTSSFSTETAAFGRYLEIAQKQVHSFYETMEINARNNTSVCNDDENDEKKAKSEVMEKLMILITHFDGK